jgi:hypothetical protein
LFSNTTKEKRAVELAANKELAANERKTCN